ncbi:MAG: hypothetical protein ACQEV7_05805 [Bacillota bacterium]
MHSDISIALLRKKQLLLMNFIMITAAFVFLGVSFYGIQLLYLNIFALIVVSHHIIAHFNPKADLIRRMFPVLKQIEEHEKAKLGTEYIALKKAQLIGNVVLILIIMFNSFIIPVDSMIAFPGSLFGVMVMLILVVVGNFSAIRHAKKVDNISPWEVKGFTKRENRFNIIFGVVFGLLTAFILITVAVIIITP